MAKTLIYITILMLAVTNSHAQTQSGPYQGIFQVGISSESADNVNQSSRLFELSSNVYLISSINKYITGRIRAEALMQSGTVQYSFFETRPPRQGLRVRHSHVILHDANKNYLLSFGVFNPNNVIQWPKWRAIGFQGGKAEAVFNWDRIKIKFNALQTVAGAEFSSRDAREHLETPRFFSEALNITTDYRDWEGKLQVYHMGFQGLPPQSAHLSRFGGNTVEGFGDALARFVYEFNGFGGFASFARNLVGAWKVGGEFYYLQNVKAPSGINKGHEYVGFSEFPITEDYKMRIDLGYFMRGSDVFPAYYLASDQSQANQVGRYLRANVAYLPSDFYIQLYFSQGQAIRRNPFQNEFTFIGVNLVQNYDIF